MGCREKHRWVLGKSTINATFLVRQLQKYLVKNKLLYLTFLDIEKAFYRVSHSLIWWAMRKQEIDDWLVGAVQGYCQ